MTIKEGNIRHSLTNKSNNNNPSNNKEEER